jgi:hypothetical protein
LFTTKKRPEKLYFKNIKLYFGSLLLSIEEGLKVNNMEYINILTEEIETSTIKFIRLE